MNDTSTDNSNTPAKTPLQVYLTGPLGRLLRNRAFVICAVFLALCAGGLHLLANQLDMYLRKEAVPLKSRLQELQEERLGDYCVLHRMRIKEEIEEELGTKDYIQWVLEDTSIEEESDPRRYLSIFVTYYTGDPDRVPHVPDWCYVGGGGQVLEGNNIEWNVPDSGAPEDTIPVRILNLKVRSRDGWDWVDKTVSYFFAVNGDFRCTRNQVRLRLKSWKDRYAYFSKVEISLAQQGSLDRAEVLAALEKLARQLTPILVEDHWPDWESVKGQE